MSDARGCASAVSSLKAVQELALDCEGVSLSRSGRLCLVQVTGCTAAVLCGLARIGDTGSDTVCGLQQLFDNKTTYIFDFVATPRRDTDAMVATLKAVLESAAVPKIVHDGRQVMQYLLPSCRGVSTGGSR